MNSVIIVNFGVGTGKPLDPRLSSRLQNLPAAEIQPRRFDTRQVELEEDQRCTRVESNATHQSREYVHYCRHFVLDLTIGSIAKARVSDDTRTSDTSFGRPS